MSAAVLLLLVCYVSVSFVSSGVSTVTASSQCPGSNSLLVDSVSGHLIATCLGGIGKLVEIVASTGQMTTLESGVCTGGIAVWNSPSGRVVYATCPPGMVNISSTGQVSNMSISYTPSCGVKDGTPFVSRTGVVYASCNGYALGQFQNGLLTAQLNPPCGLSTSAPLVGISPYTDLVLGNCGSDVLWTYNGTQFTFAILPCPPAAIVFGNVSKLVYAWCGVTAGGGNSVVILNGPLTGSAITTTTLVTAAQCIIIRGLAIDPLTDTLYVACSSVFSSGVGTGVLAVRQTRVSILCQDDCPFPTNVAWNPIDGRVYVSTSNGILALTPNSSQTTSSFSLFALFIATVVAMFSH